MVKLVILGLLLAELALTFALEDTLVAVHTLFRHGDRSPAGPLPIQRYNISFWPYGWVQLTDIGMAQHYRLGKFFRMRYGNLLKKDFNYGEIEGRSSDVARCMIAAYCTMAGLYSNSTEQADLTFPYVRWQPVPVHTVPRKIDEVLALNRPCKAATDEQKLLFEGPIVKRLNTDYTKLFELITEKTGADLKNNGVKNIAFVADTLFIESQHNFPLPDWTNDSVTCGDNPVIPCKDRTIWDVMTEIDDYAYFIKYNSTVIHKYMGGPLLEDIISKLSAYEAGTRTIKFDMYSAHGRTGSALLSALGVFDKKQPRYAAPVMVELHKAAATARYKHEVKIFYKNVTDDDKVYQLELPDCPSPCSLESFKTLFDKYKILDWDKECGNTLPAGTATPAPVKGAVTREALIAIIVVCTAAVLVVALVFGIYCIRRKNRTDNLNYGMSVTVRD